MRSTLYSVEVYKATRALLSSGTGLLSLDVQHSSNMDKRAIAYAILDHIDHQSS